MGDCLKSAEPAYGLHHCTLLALQADRIETRRLRQGDTLRSEAGVVWGTLDGRLEDVLVTTDRSFTMPADGEVRLSALADPAVLAIVTQRDGSVRGALGSGLSIAARMALAQTATRLGSLRHLAR